MDGLELRLKLYHARELWLGYQQSMTEAPDNRLIELGEEVSRTAAEVACRERLGGMLRYYYRKAA